MLSPAAIDRSWELARLKHKLQPYQADGYDHIKRSPPEKIFFLLCHRGFGKTFLGCLIAIEEALKAKEGSILIVSATLKKLRTVIKPTFEQILIDCPLEYQPTYHSQDSYYQFPNGIRVHFVAAEHGRIGDIRGIHRVIMCLMDEVAFFGDEDDSYSLDYMISHILNPMFIRTKSTPRTIMLTTPATTPSHPSQKFHDKAREFDCLATFDIYHSDIPADKIEEIKQRTLETPGGPLAWQSEFECKWVVDSNRLIVPEWDKKYIQEVPRDEFFPFYHKYEFLDTGVRDDTFNGFGYYHFKLGKMVIEDEIVLRGDQVRTDILADQTKAKEKALNYQKLYRRIGDNNNLIILNDLSGPKHNLPWMATTKGVLNSNVQDEDFGMINNLRLWIQQGRVLVHPRCQYLIGCLENGIWDKTKSKFARSATYGHFDGLAALCYLVRHVDTQSNPIPAMHGFSEQTHNIPPGKEESPTYKALRTALKISKPKTTMDDYRR
jgi:hypothetical protein